MTNFKPKHNIAFICNDYNSIVLNADGTASSLSWKLNHRNIGNLLGGRISLHHHKIDQSYTQGQIVGISIDPAKTDRVIVTFVPDRAKIDGKTLSWGQEKAYH